MLYNAIQDKWCEHYDWVSFEKVYAKKKIFPFSYIKELFRALKRVYHTEYETTRKLPNYKAWEAINNNSECFINQKDRVLNSDLLDFIFKHSKSNYNGEDKRFECIYLMMWAMAQYQSLKEFHGEDRVILMSQGELFLNRIMHFINQSFSSDDLAEYLSLIPKPSGVIFVQCSTEVIVERIGSRERVSTVHQGMDREDIFEYTKRTMKTMHTMHLKLQQSGVQSIIVDSEQPIDYNSSVCIDFFNSIE